MIPKPLDQVVGTDLDALIQDQLREGKTIDYKETLPGTTDADKKELLADASSFANTIGGDLILGVSESAGVPTKVAGLAVSDFDAEIRRLDSMLNSGLAPRMRYHMRPVSHSNGTVLVLRVDRSWIGPHRVVYKGHDKFYARNSAGKYPMDVSDLRSAFLLTASLVDRIRGFRDDRLLEI